MRPTPIRLFLFVLIFACALLPAAVTAAPSSVRPQQGTIPQISAGDNPLAAELLDVLGFAGARRYLVIVQNNHELRPTGGFIAAVGDVVIENGRIAGMEFEDSYQIFRQNFRYPNPPAPLERYMNTPMLVFRDANWSPDLPTAARLLSSIYAGDTGRQVDGVVTVDLRAVELFLEAIGPLEIEGADAPLTAANVVEQFKQMWARPATVDATVDTDDRQELGAWWRERKAFIPAAANAALARLQGGNVPVAALAAAGHQALHERAIQVWMPQPGLAGLLAYLGWDGGMKPEPGADYLALVDSNVGFNKVDMVMARSLDYRVEWPDGPDAAGIATATVTYTHTLAAEVGECVAAPEYGEDYDAMAARCYFDYVRLYAPGGSRLLELSGVQEGTAEERMGEVGTQVFAGYFSVPPGESRTVTFRYRLPEELGPDGYRLVVQRQAGAGPLPLQVEAGGQGEELEMAAGRWTWTPQP